MLVWSKLDQKFWDYAINDAKLFIQYPPTQRNL